MWRGQVTNWDLQIYTNHLLFPTMYLIQQMVPQGFTGHMVPHPWITSDLLASASARQYVKRKQTYSISFQENEMIHMQIPQVPGMGEKHLVGPCSHKNLVEVNNSV